MKLNLTRAKFPPCQSTWGGMFRPLSWLKLGQRTIKVPGTEQTERLALK